MAAIAKIHSEPIFDSFGVTFNLQSIVHKFHFGKLEAKAILFCFLFYRDGSCGSIDV
jgi:hypothetical protein